MKFLLFAVDLFAIFTSLLSFSLKDEIQSLKNTSVRQAFTCVGDDSIFYITALSEGKLYLTNERNEIEIFNLTKGESHGFSRRQNMSILWTNASHLAGPMFLHEEQQLVMEDFLVNWTYSDNTRLKIGSFAINMNWHRPLNGIPINCTIESGKQQKSASCTTTSASFKSISADVAYKDIRLKIFKNEGGCITSSYSPPFQVSCSNAAKFCEKPCSKPGNSHVNAEWVNTSLVVHWYPPVDSGDGVYAYAIRWGVYSKDPLGHEIDGFPIENTVEFKWVLVQHQNQMPSQFVQVFEYTFNIRDYIDQEEIAVQVVGLCKKDFEANKRIMEEAESKHQANDVRLESVFKPAKFDQRLAKHYKSYATENMTAPILTNRTDTSPNTTSDSSEKEKVFLKGTLSNDLVIVFSVTVAALAMFGAFLIYWRKTRSVKKGKMHAPAEIFINGFKLNPIYKTWYANTAEPDEWEISLDCITWGDAIGSGAFGEVFKCMLKQADTSIDVAVKTVKESAIEFELEQFVKEMLIMKQIGQHRNVLSLIGCVTLYSPLSIIMEYAVNGDVLSFLHTQRSEKMKSRSSDDLGYSFDLFELLRMADDIASGMEFISGRGFVHRDLAARNLLLDKNLTVKISDFGLARYMSTQEVYIVSHCRKLPVKWMSIEALSDGVFTTASDVWAFGIVLYELATLGTAPYPTLDPESILPYLKDGNRMACPDGCHPLLYEMMISCWKAEPTERPSFSGIRDIVLETIALTSNQPTVSEDDLHKYPSVSDEGFLSDNTQKKRAQLTSTSSDCSETMMIINQDSSDESSLTLRPMDKRY